MSSVYTFLRQGACRYKKKSKSKPKVIEKIDESISTKPPQVQCEKIVEQIEKLQITTTAILSSYTPEETKYGPGRNEVAQIAKELKATEDKLFVLKQKIGLAFPGATHLLKTDDVDVDFKCGVCLDTFIKPILLQCSHMFCEWCIESWSRKRNHCPTCRSAISHKTYCLAMDNIVKKSIDKGPAIFKEDYYTRVQTRFKEGYLEFECENDNVQQWTFPTRRPATHIYV